MIMHFEDPDFPPISACGREIPRERKTSDTSQVTCRSCRKTDVFDVCASRKPDG